MAFSFNWSGISVPAISGKRDVQNTAMQFDAAGRLGRAARGWQDKVETDKLNAEYADILNGYSTENPNVSKIRAQIDELKAQNAELMKRRAQLGG